ncbi:hypothetical protein COCON_G00008280 [Conger conger]|uniref:Uncharacterized protein n=1 Tax=Conger conger TaxID=82655 RepID=A0A9Q1E234_CONCO|nr:UPF0711 protein C18orf21 homolog [Conger conger]KAJ8288169.1 hypothetical protein COCON_G00008280 [Conger conger]
MANWLGGRPLTQKPRMATFVSLVTCQNCNNLARHNVINRDYMMGFSRNYCTPSPANKYWIAGRYLHPACRGRSPHTKTATTIKPPSTRQRSSSSESSSSSSSSTGSEKKLAFDRLRKFLLLGNEQKRVKDGLKFFLPAL